MINAKDFFVKDKKSCSISDKKVSELIEILRSEKNVKKYICKGKTKKTLKKNDYDLCPQRYIVNNPMDDIVIEDTEKMDRRYKRLKEELNSIEEYLQVIRKRFI